MILTVLSLHQCYIVLRDRVPIICIKHGQTEQRLSEQDFEVITSVHAHLGVKIANNGYQYKHSVEISKAKYHQYTTSSQLYLISADLSSSPFPHSFPPPSELLVQLRVITSIIVWSSTADIHDCIVSVLCRGMVLLWRASSLVRQAYIINLMQDIYCIYMYVIEYNTLSGVVGRVFERGMFIGLQLNLHKKSTYIMLSQTSRAKCKTVNLARPLLSMPHRRVAQVFFHKSCSYV